MILVLAAARPGVRGTVLMHGALDPAGLGVEAWPGVPVQVHCAVGDPLMDADQVEALEAAARQPGVRTEARRYERVGHLFEDPGIAEYDPPSAELMLERVLRFLDGIDRTPSD